MTKKASMQLKLVIPNYNLKISCIFENKCFIYEKQDLGMKNSKSPTWVYHIEAYKGLGHGMGSFYLIYTKYDRNLDFPLFDN